jgi:hypothetical protein
MGQDDIEMRLGCKISGFVNDLKGAHAEASNFVGRVQKMFAGGVIAGAAMKAGQYLGAMVEQIHKLGAASSNLGMSVETIQGFNRLARLGSADAEIASQGLNKFVTSIGAARQGMPEAVKLFNALGLSLETSTGKTRNNTSILKDFLDRLKAIPDPAERVRYAVLAVGEAGAKMAIGLAQGSDGLDKMSKKMGNLTSGQVAVIDQARDIGKGLKDNAVLGVAWAAVIAKTAISTAMHGPAGFVGAVADYKTRQAISDSQDTYQRGGNLGRTQERLDAEKSYYEYRDKSKLNQLSLDDKIRASTKEQIKLQRELSSISHSLEYADNDALSKQYFTKNKQVELTRNSTNRKTHSRTEQHSRSLRLPGGGSFVGIVISTARL